MLNTLMNVRRFFLLLMTTPVQMERMLATVLLPMGGMIGVQAIGAQVMNVQLGRMKTTSAFLRKTLMVRLMFAQGGVRRSIDVMNKATTIVLPGLKVQMNVLTDFRKMTNVQGGFPKKMSVISMFQVRTNVSLELLVVTSLPVRFLLSMSVLQTKINVEPVSS